MSCGAGAAFGKIIIKMITDISQMTVHLDVAVDILIEKVKQEAVKAAIAAAEEAKQKAIAMAMEKAMEQIPACPPMEPLMKIIETKNQIQEGLQEATKVLEPIETITTNVNSTLEGLKIAVTIIKQIPIPTAIIPPTGGIGLPMSVMTTYSSQLDTLGDLICNSSGVASMGGPAVQTIQSMVNDTLSKLSVLDGLIKECIEEQTKDMNEEDKADYIDEMNHVLAEQGSFGDKDLNYDEEWKLIKQLERCDYIYKGYKFCLEYEPNNAFSFPSRRIKAEKLQEPFKGRVAYNTGMTGDLGMYSYTNSVTTLVGETQVVIDDFNRWMAWDDPEFGIQVGNREFTKPYEYPARSGKYWKYDDTSWDGGQIYWEGPEGELITFYSEDEYRNHRKNYGWPWGHHYQEPFSTTDSEKEIINAYEQQIFSKKEAINFREDEIRRWKSEIKVHKKKSKGLRRKKVKKHHRKEKSKKEGYIRDRKSKIKKFKREIEGLKKKISDLGYYYEETKIRWVKEELMKDIEVRPLVDDTLEPPPPTEYPEKEPIDITDYSPIGHAGKDNLPQVKIRNAGLGDEKIQYFYVWDSFNQRWNLFDPIIKGNLIPFGEPGEDNEQRLYNTKDPDKGTEVKDLFEWSDFYYKWVFKRRLPKSFQLPNYSVAEKIGKKPKDIKIRKYSPKTKTQNIQSTANTRTSNVGTVSRGY